MADREDPLYQVVGAMLQVDPSDLDDSSSPQTVASWESTTHLGLVMALEEEFGVSLTPEEALEMETVGLIRAILRDHGVEV